MAPPPPPLPPPHRQPSQGPVSETRKSPSSSSVPNHDYQQNNAQHYLPPQGSSQYNANPDSFGNYQTSPPGGPVLQCNSTVPHPGSSHTVHSHNLPHYQQYRSPPPLYPKERPPASVSSYDSDHSSYASQPYDRPNLPSNYYKDRLGHGGQGGQYDQLKSNYQHRASSQSDLIPPPSPRQPYKKHFSQSDVRGRDYNRGGQNPTQGPHNYSQELRDRGRPRESSVPREAREGSYTREAREGSYSRETSASRDGDLRRTRELRTPDPWDLRDPRHEAISKTSKGSYH